jgi:hypothetical protein
VSPEYAGWECFYGPVLHNQPFSLLMQKDSVEVYVRLSLR